MGARVGISAKYRIVRKYSFIRQKIKFFHWSIVQSVQGENTLYLLLQTLYFLYPHCDMQSRLPSSEQWRRQMVRSLTSWCVVKIPALRRMSSCSPVTPVKDQSDLYLSMSFTQDNNSTSFTDLVWPRRA